MTDLISAARAQFHQDLLDEILTQDKNGVVSCADKDSAVSVKLARLMADQLGQLRVAQKRPGQTAGRLFETSTYQFLQTCFNGLHHLRPGQWLVERPPSKKNRLLIADYDQYAHLIELKQVTDQNKALASIIGTDYLILPDIIIAKTPVDDSLINADQAVITGPFANRTPYRAANASLATLHASISCKWTMRSDRAQNSRSEALNLIRNRKGRVPHIVVVTAEPLPSRIASIALGTGDLDCTYHIALPELVVATEQAGYEDAAELLQTMIDGRRLRDISDLPFDLVI